MFGAAASVDRPLPSMTPDFVKNSRQAIAATPGKVARVLYLRAPEGLMSTRLLRMLTPAGRPRFGVATCQSGADCNSCPAWVRFLSDPRRLYASQGFCSFPCTRDSGRAEMMLPGSRLEALIAHPLCGLNLVPRSNSLCELVERDARI